MAKAVTIADRVYVYDNSIENEMPKLLYRTVDGKLFKKYVDNIPAWAKLVEP